MQNADKKTFLHINLKAIKKNYKIIRNVVKKKCIVAATVKANAYGLGVDKVSSALIKSGCKYFFVATTNEAIQLRKVDKLITIFILNGLITKDISLIRKYNLVPVINNLDQLKKIEKFQHAKNIKINIALHFDTGMSRLGFDSNETKNILKNKQRIIKYSKILLVMSHLACADDKNAKFNIKQLDKFNKIKTSFPDSMHSLASSAGIKLGKKYHFDMVRPGISLYGGQCQKKEKMIFQNVVSLKASLLQIRDINKNDSIGYGATYKAKSKMKIGTVGLGYADGFNRLFSNNYYLYVRNKKVKIVGRVSMDLITINLSKIDGDLYSEEIEIFGDNNSINNISQRINTIPYEILTNLGKRYQRIYIS